MTQVVCLVTVAFAAAMAITVSSCNGVSDDHPRGGQEVLTTISCKNESKQELWDARVVLDERIFGLGLVNIGSKKAMAAGNLSGLKNAIVYYSFYPADGNPKSGKEKAVEYPAEKLAAVANDAGEVEMVCRGDGKWLVRVYKRSADNDGPIILEGEMIEKNGP